MDKVNLADKFAAFANHWSPQIVADVNGHEIMLVKAEGEFVWHSHENSDDFFLVIEGELDIELRDRTVCLGPGELFVVPRGIEHRPVARKGEVKLLLIEPQGVTNTGDPATAATKVRI